MFSDNKDISVLLYCRKLTLKCSMIDNGGIMFRIAICDDNLEFLDSFEVLVKKYIEPYCNEFSIDKYTNGVSMLAIHRQAPFNVIFLDIDMPIESGLDIAKEFRSSDNRVYIIFVTNHTKYVYDSFEVQPFNYIVKSNNQSFERKLSSVIKSLFNHLKQNQIIILDDSKNGCISVRYNEIKYIESKQHYCVFHINSKKTDKTTYKIRKSISELENELTYYDFVRTHKKFVVNLSYILSIDKNNRFVNFKDGTNLSLGPVYKAEVEKRFFDYLRKH